jgi:peptide/nickel transport system permease protein
MTIEQNTEQSRLDRLEALDTAGAQPFPPAGDQLQYYGPVAEIPPADPVSQAERDRLADTEAVTEGQSLSPLQASLRRLGRDRRAMLCLGIILFIVVASYVAPYFYTHVGGTILGGLTQTTPEGPDRYHSFTWQELALLDNGPSLIHPLGNDYLGRDMLARLMAGVNISIEVALLVEFIDIGVGLLVGTLAGFFGSWIDTFLARFTDVMFAFPGLLFAILMAATLGSAFQNQFGPPGKLILVSIALGVAVWPQMARFVRGQTLQLKEQQFVEASRTVGGTNRAIITRHIMPNLFSIVVAVSTLNVVNTIVGEATISLLGLGIQAPGSSLGLMINDGVSRINRQPLEVLVPSLMLVLLVVCLAFIGDGVRDAFDPRTKD